jgi:outer membrane receptor protein involved in Fe transport
MADFFTNAYFVGADVYASRLTDFVTDVGFGLNPQFPPYQPPAGLSPETAATIISALRSALPPPLFAGLTNLPGGQPAFVLSPTNAGRVDTHGFEAEIHDWFTPRWSVEANYSWFKFNVKEDLPGNPILPNAPEHRFNIGAHFIDAAWKASLWYRWVDSFRWSAGLFNGPVPSYSVVDFAMERTFTHHLDVGLNVANALNNEHYELFGGDVLRRRALISLSYRSRP